MLEPLLRVNLPTMYDLPSEEVGEPGLPDEFHCWQGPLLSLTFRPPSWPGEQVFSAYDLYLYYDPEHTLWYKRPDWFGVVGVPRLYQGKDSRQSYVIWQEQVTPAIAIEILSPSTEKEDLGKTKRKAGEPPTKWQVYEQILKIPNYVVFDENTRLIRLFQLVNGNYQQTALTESMVWIEDVQLNLGLWNGDWNKSFRARWWLRWYDRDGDLIFTPEEIQQQRAIQAEQGQAFERDRAAQAERAKERLAAKLRELGLDPDQV